MACCFLFHSHPAGGRISQKTTERLLRKYLFTSVIQTDKPFGSFSLCTFYLLIMSKLQLFNVFLSERLTAAAVEIFGAVEKTISEYEEDIYRSKKEIERLQRLLTLHRPDPQNFTEEDVPPQECLDQKRIPSPRQDYPDPTQIKVEQQQLAISQEEEHLHGLESDIKEVIITPFLKSDSEQDIPQPLHLHQIQNGENKKNKCVSINRTELDMKVEPDEAGYQVSETNSGQTADTICSVPEPLSIFQSLSSTNSDCSEELTANSVRVDIRRSTLRKQSGQTCLNSPPLIDTGEKLYGCHMCSKCFLTQEYLQKHMQMHAGEKKFDCNFCRKHFTRKCHLAEHVRTLHPGENLFDLQMPSSSKERTARHRARINADPDARELYLAKRRARYQRRRAQGKRDYPPIELMSEAAKRLKREQWRAAQKKCREKCKVRSDLTAVSLKDTEKHLLPKHAFTSTREPCTTTVFSGTTKS
ncbi:hypothetical protein UPYG_G00166140 [Umbra pygmaea]|uniref:C2H2-type domain-containing protein n=1 Tax=Umbra pygmaea TaxID=75934 RepID=A0ABD0WML6_UMBPY